MQRQGRLPDQDWIAAVRCFFAEGREVLASIKYLYNSPPQNFALLRSLDQLHLLVEICPNGAEITLWRDASLPFRGPLTPALLEAARSSIAENVESLCIFTESGSGTDPRLQGDSWHLSKYMFTELKERMGESVAMGAWPDGASGSSSAIKGGIDGPR